MPAVRGVQEEMTHFTPHSPTRVSEVSRSVKDRQLFLRFQGPAPRCFGCTLAAKAICGAPSQQGGPAEPVAVLHITSRLLPSFHPSHNLYTVFSRSLSSCSWGLFKTGGVCVFSGGSPLLLAAEAVWSHWKRVKTPSVCANRALFFIA